MNFWRRGDGLECMFCMTRSLELQALPYALNRPPRAAASFNKITGANAGGPRPLPMRTRWAARVAQFCRWLKDMRIRGSFAAGVATLLVLCGAVSIAVGFHFAHLQACVGNMRMIAGAKGSYGLEQRLSIGDRVVPGMISPLLKGGWQAHCPSGGQYEPGLFTGGKETGDAQHAPACGVHGSLARLDSDCSGFFALPRDYFLLSIACIVLAGNVVLAYLLGSSRPRSQRRCEVGSAPG